MKRNIIFSLLMFILISSIAAGAADIKDVPQDHWAYQSVKTLVDKGLISLYDDGTFRGKESVSRFELAEVVARLLENLQGGTTQASEQDVDLLRKLSLEFRDELVELAKNDDAFSARLEQIEQKNVRQDNRITGLEEVDMNTSQELAKLNQKMSDLSVELNSTNQQVTTISDKVANIQSDVTNIIDNILKIKSLEEEIASLKEKMTQLDNSTSEKIAFLEEELSQTKTVIDQHEEQFASLESKIADNETITSLKDQQAVNSSRINALQRDVNQLKDQANGQEVKEVKKNTAKDQNYLYGIAIVSAIAILLSM